MTELFMRLCQSSLCMNEKETFGITWNQPDVSVPYIDVSHRATHLSAVAHSCCRETVFFPPSPFVITFDLLLYVNSAHTQAISQTNSSSRWVYRKVICLAWIRRCNLGWWCAFFFFFSSLLGICPEMSNTGGWAHRLNFSVQFISLKSLFDNSCLPDEPTENDKPTLLVLSVLRSALVYLSYWFVLQAPRLFVSLSLHCQGALTLGNPYRPVRFVWLVWAQARYAFSALALAQHGHDV